MNVSVLKIDMKNALSALSTQLDGELYFDELMNTLYATDASVYRILPLAVAIPKNIKDLQKLISFANKNATSLIPRAAGTSLAGQCVGEGIVVDTSKYFTRILNIDEKNKTVTLQPGVVRDALNLYLRPFGLFFGPDTSTSNRCMIGGMVGNNSSGTTSIKYGVTRDKVLSIKAILSDGTLVEFKNLSKDEFREKLNLDSLEGDIYRQTYELLKNPITQNNIRDNFPKPEIHRRNTGYAIDELINTNVFTETEKPFNFCKILSGSEGTLSFTTEVTLQLDILPPIKSLMIAAHFDSIAKCMSAVEPLMQFGLYSCEMMDKTILDCTKYNKEQSENRVFIQGDPKAILLCELKSDNEEELLQISQLILKELDRLRLSYHNAILKGNDIGKALDLRKAGLGLLGNIVGDAKGVACIEDTAVALSDLSNYIKEFSQLMKHYGQDAIYYAHAGAGELHLRPILNLKKSEDVVLFQKITEDIAILVKKYGGSMSGEHGDGIVRSNFIKNIIGEENVEILQRIKTAFDPQNIFNPGKIVDPLPMTKNLRYEVDRKEPEIETIMDFSKSLGILRAAEKCNGSGDCRKLPEFGGTMCPSYRATLNEKDTTRARANALREFLTNSDKQNKFDHMELKEVFELCLSCKACASECPSSVDVASLKAEFQYQYNKANGISKRTKLFAYNNLANQRARKVLKLYNYLSSAQISSYFIKKIGGISTNRSIPRISNKSLDRVYKESNNESSSKKYIKTVYLFNDEFTNQLDTDIGIDALKLLEALNYKVKIIDNVESGRSLISKGLLDEAKNFANQNVSMFKDIITNDTPLIGIEPSAIFTFIDEYPKLAEDKIAADEIATNTFLIEEFLQQEIRLGNIKSESFTTESKSIKFHGHCHQKALRDQSSSFEVLNLPKNYTVTIIPSGCCGMAGSFGYEKEHYDISMQIGEQTLFPAIRTCDDEVIISANGTSCRHQIKDGTSRNAHHPISILAKALI